MRYLYAIANILPRLIEFWERLCIRIASEGFHKPGFYLAGVFFAVAGLRLWRRPITQAWKRLPARIAAYPLMIAGLLLFLKGAWVFSVLLLFGRIARRIWMKAGFDQSRPFPSVLPELSFPIERIDKAVLVFIAIILVVMFTNRSQLMPKDDSDHNYHMAVARQIIEQKGIPKWDDWEYAPAGRPHLYPPVLHILIATFAGSAEKVSHGFETLQVVAYPLGLLLAWWFTRWLFGPATAFFAALVLSMDMTCTLVTISVLPSALVTVIMPLVLMCFLTKRSKWTIALLALALYTHMGVAWLMILGLFFFSARYQGYYDFFKHTLAWAFAFYVPWFLRLAGCIDWIGTPSSALFSDAGRGIGAAISATLAGLLSLQFINVVFLVLGLIGLKKFAHPASGVIRTMLAGFLPMLVTYGGRFWMHTTPLWAILIASLLTRFATSSPSRKRLAVCMLCTLIPLPVITVGFGGKGVGLLPNIGGATFALSYVLSPQKDDDDFNRLADFIRRHTSAREIVHVDPSRQYLGDRIVHETGRRVDVGGWSAEVRNRRMLDVVAEYRKRDTNCLFVHENAEMPADLYCDRVETIGRFRVGIRGKTDPLATQTHPPEPPRQERQ